MRWPRRDTQGAPATLRSCGSPRMYSTGLRRPGRGRPVAGSKPAGAWLGEYPIGSDVYVRVNGAWHGARVTAHCLVETAGGRASWRLQAQRRGEFPALYPPARVLKHPPIADLANRMRVDLWAAINAYAVAIG